MLTVLGLIPARGGSKGIARKNIRLLGDKPLLAYTAEAALASRRLTAIVLSTEDEEIAEVARSYGVPAPFRRPAELALDTTPMLPVVQNALRWFEDQGRRFDAVCLLQPTYPFRAGADIDAAIDLFDAAAADTVMSMQPVPAKYHPHWVFLQAPDGTVHLSTRERTPIGRRQDLPEAFHRDGSIYITRSHVVLEEGSLYGVRTLPYVSTRPSVNIDTMDDWLRAEALVGASVADR